MNPEQGKSLTPKSLLDAAELERMRPERMAQIMARWPPNVSEYFRLKYAGEEHLHPTVFNWLVREARERAIREDWPMGKFYRLVELVIREALVRGTCPHCEEGRYRKANGDWATCGKCHGSGRVRYTQWKKAKALKVNSSDWSRTWEQRYQHVAQPIAWAETVITERR